MLKLRRGSQGGEILIFIETFTVFEALIHCLTKIDDGGLFLLAYPGEGRAKVTK